VALITIGNGADGHNACTGGNTFDSNVIVAVGSNNARNVRPVAGIGTYHISITVISLGSILIIIADNITGIKIGIVAVFSVIIDRFLLIGNESGVDIVFQHIAHHVLCKCLLLVLRFQALKLPVGVGGIYIMRAYNTLLLFHALLQRLDVVISVTQLVNLILIV